MFSIRDAGKKLVALVLVCALLLIGGVMPKSEAWWEAKIHYSGTTSSQVYKVWTNHTYYLKNTSGGTIYLDTSTVSTFPSKSTKTIKKGETCKFDGINGYVKVRSTLVSRSFEVTGYCTSNHSYGCDFRKTR